MEGLSVGGTSSPTPSFLGPFREGNHLRSLCGPVTSQHALEAQSSCGSEIGTC